jgi:hypothetical protein
MAKNITLTNPTTIFGKIAMALLFLPGKPSTGNPVRRGSLPAADNRNLFLNNR